MNDALLLEIAFFYCSSEQAHLYIIKKLTLLIYSPPEVLPVVNKLFQIGLHATFVAVLIFHYQQMKIQNHINSNVPSAKPVGKP